MIESEFDRVIRGENNNYGTNKKSKLKVIIAVIIFIILVGVSVWGYMSYSQYKIAMPKIKFFEYISKTNTEKLLDFSILEGIYSKMEQNSYTINNDISISVDGQESWLSNLNANINYYKDNEKNLNKADVIINNKDDEVIKLTGLADSKNIGIKSDEIVVKYIGSKFENLSKLFNKYATQEEQDDSKEKITLPNKDMLNVYKEILNSKLLDEQFSIEKNVRLTEGNSSIEATLYELSFDKQEILQILTELQDTLINHDELINCLITGNVEEQLETEENIYSGITPTDALNLVTGYKINASKDDVKQEIENNFTKIYETLNSIENLNFKFDIYVSNSKVVKEAIIFENLLELNIDFQNTSENENSLKATILFENQEEQSKDGVSITFNRKNNNVTTDFVLEMCLIQNGQINNKVIAEIKLEGNSSSTNVNNNLKITYSDTENEYTLKVKSKLEYGLNIEIEELNSENCLFLDELDDSTREIVINSVYEKGNEVINNKINSIFNPEENNQNNEIVDIDGESEEEKAEKKQSAKTKLVDAVREEMQKAQDEEREYTLANLQDLKIENSIVSVMVNENLAIVAIDGFTFYIDPNFNLTEE